MNLSMNNKIKSFINIFPENMVHFIFLLKLAISRNTTKLVSQFLDLRNRRYDFCKKAKIRIVNKRKRGKGGDSDSGPRLSGSSPPRPRRLSPAICPRQRGLRPNQGHHCDPQTLATRLIPFSPWRSHWKRLAVDHGGSAEVLGVTPEPSGR